jgi:hypothetical protein
MPTSSPSLVRRLALPLTLAVLLHVLGVGFVWLLPVEGATQQAGTTSFDFSVRVGSLDPPQRPRPAAPAQTPNDIDRSELILPPRSEGHKIEVTTGRHPTAASGNQDDQPGDGNMQGPAQPATRGLLAVQGTARRIVYLIDRSLSMGQSGALDVARQEVLASLRGLPGDASFQIIAYNFLALRLLPGQLVRAEPAMIDEATRQLAALDASGGTRHLRALKCALTLQPAPDLIFLVTDADELTDADVRDVTRLNSSRHAAIHVVELASALADGGGERLLARLAADNGGTHRRVRVRP